MGLITDLNAMQSRLEQDVPRQKQDGPRVDFLKIKDGQKLRIRFLQELDRAAEGYNKEAGTGVLAVEHSNPKNFMLRALCTKDDDFGECFGCEQHQADFKAGWRPKVRLYINVLVEHPDSDSQVVVLAQGNGSKSITKGLIEYAAENGTITAQPFSLKREGAGQTDTSYILTPLKYDTERYDVTNHELFDLSKVVKNVPYEEQEAFYLGQKSKEPEKQNWSNFEAESTDIKW